MREITHLWYSSWPATGVPEDGKTVVALLMEARKGQSKENKTPIVVHCSPGTGRTGAVLAIDVCMRHLDSSRSIDIPRCVHRLRQDRAGCVQTGEQYAFIYKVKNKIVDVVSVPFSNSLFSIGGKSLRVSIEQQRFGFAVKRQHRESKHKWPVIKAGKALTILYIHDDFEEKNDLSVFSL